MNRKCKTFSKSFLIHNDILQKINESKRKFKYKVENIELSEKVTSLLGVNDVSNEEDSLKITNKLNANYRDKKKEENVKNEKVNKY